MQGSLCCELKRVRMKLKYKSQLRIRNWQSECFTCKSARNLSKLSISISGGSEWPRKPLDKLPLAVKSFLVCWVVQCEEDSF